MNFLQYLLIIIILSLSFIFGLLIRHFAKEEVKPGKKVIEGTKWVVLFSIILNALFFDSMVGYLAAAFIFSATFTNLYLFAVSLSFATFVFAEQPFGLILVFLMGAVLGIRIKDKTFWRRSLPTFLFIIGSLVFYAAYAILGNV